MSETSQVAEIPQQEIDEALVGIIYDGLRPVSIGFGCLYLFFVFAHSLTLPYTIAVPMVSVAAASAVFFFMFATLVTRAMLPRRFAHLTATLMAQVALFNCLIHLYLSGEVYQSTNILLVIVGVGSFFLSTRGVLSVWLTTLVGWSLIIQSFPPSPEKGHFAFAVVATTIIAFLVFYVRLRMYQRLERLRLQDVRQKTELEQALAAAQAAERLKDELISTVSHELRTPLTSLQGFTELMLQREFPRPKQEEMLTIMHNESLHLRNLINNFLDLQKIQTGHSQYHFTDVQLGPLLSEAVTLFATADGKHTWYTDIPDHLPPVHIDADRIRQVIANLISNAVKFSPRGGPITIAVAHQETELLVSIRDQGMGIPQEAVPKLFTKFFRVDNSATRAINGTGLGLALVKEIVEAHRGRVWVESSLEKGSTFFFTLPLASS